MPRKYTNWLRTISFGCMEGNSLHSWESKNRLEGSVLAALNLNIDSRHWLVADEHVQKRRGASRYGMDNLMGGPWSVWPFKGGTREAMGRA